ncbi:hypothetical protein AB3480_20355 [Rhizobium mongolense]|uniref:hypothetical protein n=1 Tax=Rhizobium mongolense TaxID=57676 RepID=UPI0034A17CEF
MNRLLILFPTTYFLLMVKLLLLAPILCRNISRTAFTNVAKTSGLYIGHPLAPYAGWFEAPQAMSNAKGTLLSAYITQELHRIILTAAGIRADGLPIHRHQRSSFSP